MQTADSSDDTGKLNETYPARYEDTPAFQYFPSVERNSEYRESIYVGYRYYDTVKVRILYPFGFGLSYTQFSYSDLKADSKGIEFCLTNIGEMDGSEIVQFYVGKKDARVFRPEKELNGFSKVFLKAGESRNIRIDFDDKTFRYWNIRTSKWEKEDGEYHIMVGASSADIRLETEIHVDEKCET